MKFRLSNICKPSGEFHDSIVTSIIAIRVFFTVEVLAVHGLM